MTDLVRDSEFHRYYAPFRSAVADRDRSRSRGGLRSSDDRALTAFAQLGALRLQVRRCAISFFDEKTQYVLAEATQTLSLQTDEPDPAHPKDALLWGVAEFPLTAGLCQYTMRLPLEFLEAEDGSRTEVAVNCVPDMLKDERFRDLPFVCGFPDTRFYAAVPIRSPNGIAFGSYCVMGDEPKSGLTSAEIAFLKDMATTVVVHLDMIRAREDIRRNALLIQGLCSFVEGKSSMWKGGLPELERSNSVGKTQKWYEKQYSMHQSSTPKPIDSPPRDPSDPAITNRSSGKDNATTAPPDLDLCVLKGTGSEEQPSRAVVRRATTSEVTQDQIKRPDVRQAFARAASIMHESTDVDGVAIYDVKTPAFSALLDSDATTESTRRTSRSTTEAANSPGCDEHGAHCEKQAKQKSKNCGLIGYATTPSSALREKEAVALLSKLPEEVLCELLKRHRIGHIFSLDDCIAPPVGTPAGTTPCLEDDTINTRTENLLYCSERSVLRRVFPGIRYMLLIPFFDVTKKSNFAAGIIWSSDVERAALSEQALTYFTAFADSVMAEVARIEVKLADRTKSDFISTISHELRSPLHGILGGVQALRDTHDHDVERELMHTVEICGRTLLDTIEHLLDFAKIINVADDSSSTSDAGRKGSVHDERDSAGDERSGESKAKIHREETAVDLARITEDVVRTVKAGFAYTHVSSSVNSSNVETLDAKVTERAPDGNQVAVVLEIDRSGETVWSHRAHAGAWSRIVMNLFGNSLKYTSSGQIRVQLKSAPSEASMRNDVTLTVSDTGLGMSQEFQDGRMFTPYAQESYLNPGTGLGLSIIKRIIADMDGTITIQSEQNCGTTVQVRVSLECMPDLELSSAPVQEVVSTSNTAESTPSSASKANLEIETEKTTNGDISPAVFKTVQRVSSNSHPTDCCTKARRVLLVDDNSINLRLLTMYMKKQGHHFETATNGLEALIAYQKATGTIHGEANLDSTKQHANGTDPIEKNHDLGPFDYILMDLSMPVMDGLESTRRIRAHEDQIMEARKAAGTPYRRSVIIALTGLASAQTRQEAYDSGMDAFMSKPFNLADLTKLMTADEELQP